MAIRLQEVGEAEEPHSTEEVEVQSFAIAIEQLADNTDNRPRSFDNPHMQHRDLSLDNTAHIERCSLLD